MKKKPPLVYVILLNYKNYQDTLECIKSVNMLSYSNFKIIVLDNDSRNGSEENIKKFIKESAWKNVIFIQTGANLGFVGGNNIGIKYALNDEKMQYVWLLNNDTEVDKLALTNLVNKMDSNGDNKTWVKYCNSIQMHRKRVL